MGLQRVGHDWVPNTTWQPSGFPGGTGGKEPACQWKRQKRCGLDPWVRTLGRFPGGVTATHSNILAWKIPWAEEPYGLQPIGSQRVRHNWSDWAHMHTCMATYPAHGEKKRFRATQRQKQREHGERILAVRSPTVSSLDNQIYPPSLTMIAWFQ